MKIEKYLLDKRMNPAHLGFKYMATALEMLLNGETMNKKMTGEDGFYDKIAQIHNTTWERTERAIRHTIECTGAMMTVSEFLATAEIELKIQEQESKEPMHIREEVKIMKLVDAYNQGTPMKLLLTDEEVQKAYDSMVFSEFAELLIHKYAQYIKYSNKLEGVI